MTGIAAPTAASKFSAPPCFSAALASRRPCLAISALLAVTTDLPDFSAASIADSAGSPEPPINSTKQSMPGSLASASGVLGPVDAAQIEAALFRLRARGDRDHAHAAAAARRQRAALLLDEADDFGANGAEPRNTHFQGCDHDEKNLPERLTRHDRRDRAYRRLARGTTLCNVSMPLSRKRRTPRAAWRIRCSFSTMAMRT